MSTFVITFDCSRGTVEYPPTLKNQDINQVLTQYTSHNRWRVVHLAVTGEYRHTVIVLEQIAPASSTS